MVRTFKTVDEYRAHFRDLIKDCATTEDKLRVLRGYHIPQSWHYPDERERCPYCPATGEVQLHRPNLDIRGYLGTGPFAIISHTPSGDHHFKLNQARLYYALLKKHCLEDAFQADVRNTPDKGLNSIEQKALFLVQIEVVQPRAMLVMDMSAKPKKFKHGWHYPEQPLPIIQEYFNASGFTFELDRDFYLRAGTATCSLPEGLAFSFGVYRVYHYTKLTDYRNADKPEQGWEKWFARVVSVARLTLRLDELKAQLEELQAEARDERKREPESEEDLEP